MYIYIYIYIYSTHYTHIHPYIYICIHVCTYMSIYVYIYIYRIPHFLEQMPHLGLCSRNLGNTQHVAVFVEKIEIHYIDSTSIDRSIDIQLGCTCIWKSYFYDNS